MICVDASVAVKWLFAEEWTDQALALLRDSVATDIPIVVPPLFPIEVTNSIRKRARAQDGPSMESALLLLEEFLALSIEIQNPEGLHRQALILSIELSMPAVYDAHYVALANSLGCLLWTDDRRLLGTIGGRLPFVRSISTYDPANH